MGYTNFQSIKKKTVKCLLLILLLGGCCIHTSKAELLIFEYNHQYDIYDEYAGEFCYYILVLDTARMKGVLCSCYCYSGNYERILFLETEITCRYSYDKDRILYYPTSYHYQTNDLLWHRYQDPTWMENKDFYFGYYIKNNWTRLENTAFRFFDPAEKKKYNKKRRKGEKEIIGAWTWSSELLSVISMSDFLMEKGIHWYPEYLDRVEELDSDKIPEYYKEYFEDCVKGRF